MDTLTDQDRTMLVIEAQHWPTAGSKEEAIREQLQMSATRYYQLLNRLLDTESALAADPVVVKRLQRIRSSRQHRRR